MPIDVHDVPDISAITNWSSINPNPGGNVLVLPSRANVNPSAQPAPSGASFTNGNAALQLPVRHPAWVLTYAGQNITADIIGMVTELEYRDTSGAQTKGRGKKSGHEADGVEVTIEDRDRRWQGQWLPVRGDVVSLQMGYEGEPYLDCGDFQVDELELKGPPDTFHLKCISAGITPSLRTPRSAAYENATLMQVAQTVATRNGLTVTGAPSDVNVSWNRITQNHETDLAFLRRLALAHNYDFTVRGGQLIFYARQALEQASPVAIVERIQTKTFEFLIKTQAVYDSSQVVYLNPQAKKLIAATSTPGGSTPSSPTGDTLMIPTRVENPQQAQLKANGALHDANMMETTGRLELEGTPLLVAGINITIQGFKAFDGIYHITASKHRLERSSGYSTEIEVRQL